MSFLAQTSLRLATGIAAIDPSRRAIHAKFVLDAMRPDGGFAGRQGVSDLYYTSFGLRCLALLMPEDRSWAEKASAFLQSQLASKEPVGIDALSWILSAGLIEAVTGVSPFDAVGLDRSVTIRRWCDALRCPGGGFGKTPTASAASTYQTFLATACLELTGKTLQEDRAVAVVLDRQQEDGGFVEIPQLRSGGTNPTAAALSFLAMQDALSEEVCRQGVDFLSRMQAGNGGFLANPQIPMPDLLSTFTTLLTLDRLGALGAVDTDAAARFVRSLEAPRGGFLAGHGDPEVDVEYTFYGLGVLALLA